MKTYHPAQLRALEQADVPYRGVSQYQWAADRANRVFDDLGTTGKDGRKASPSHITAETVRHGFLKYAKIDMSA